MYYCYYYCYYNRLRWTFLQTFQVKPVLVGETRLSGPASIATNPRKYSQRHESGVGTSDGLAAASRGRCNRRQRGTEPPVTYDPSIVFENAGFGFGEPLHDCLWLTDPRGRAIARPWLIGASGVREPAW